MTIFEPILIPREYWLDVDKFDYTTFNYEDIRCIYNSPRSLIEDFEKVNGFKDYVRLIIQKYKNKRKRNIVATISTTPPTTPPTTRIITNIATTNTIDTASHNTFGKAVKDILLNLSLLKK